MEICAISDLHGNLITDIPECEVLCICGDIIPLQIQRNLEESRKWFLEGFCNWIKILPCTKVLFTAGNHDFFLEDIYKDTIKFVNFCEDIKASTNNKAILLIDELYTYKGVRFYGFPYVRPIGPNHYWAFEDNYKNTFDIGEYNSLENLNCDVLITHDYPGKNGILNYYIEKMQNKPICFGGHWHEVPSNYRLEYYNCCLLDNSYQIKKYFNIPTVETETELETIDKVFNYLYDNISSYSNTTNDNLSIIKDYLIWSKLNLLTDYDYRQTVL